MPRDEPPRSEGVQFATGEEQRAVSNKFGQMKRLGQSGNDTALTMCLVVKVKSNAVENNTARDPGMFGPGLEENWKCSSRRWQE